MRRIKISKKHELQAKIRNKLSLPFTVLNNFMDGKSVSQKSAELAIKELEAVLKMINGIE